MSVNLRWSKKGRGNDGYYPLSNEKQHVTTAVKFTTITYDGPHT